jgi:MFS family permease
MAITLLCAILPSILFAPLSGVICDCYDRKKIIIIADSLAACTTVGLLIYLQMGQFNFIAICVINFFSAFANMLDSNAYQASLLTLLSSEHLKKANGMNQIIDSLSSMVAPVCAGILYYPLGLQGMLIIDLCTYAIAMMLFVKVPSKGLSDIKKQERREKEKGKVFAGFRFIFKQKGLTLLMLFFALFNFLMNITNSLTEPLALSVSGSVAMGMVKMAGGVGILLGSVYITTHDLKISYGKGIFYSAITAGVAMCIMGIRNNIVFIIVGEFLFLFVNPIVNTLAGTLWILKTPKELQGRVYAARSMVSKCIVPIAYVVVGPLVDWIIPITIKNSNIVLNSILGTENLNYRIVYVCSGLVAIVCATIFFSRKDLRQLEKEI